jgi:ribosomal-protein-alanine N-acetyltransferase
MPSIQPPALPIPVLHGETVTLRPHRAEDVQGVFERATDAEARRWTVVPLRYIRAMAEEYVAEVARERPEEVSWAIEREGRYAGSIDLRVRSHLEGHGCGSLGFVAHQAFRGQGVMSEAARVVVDHAFRGLGFEFVQWAAHVGNYGSCKTVWRTGFPVPVAVPALLDHRGVMADGWHSTLWRGDPREPVAPWEQVYAVLERHVREARRPG